MWGKTRHYLKSIEYKDISISLNEVYSWIDMPNALDLSKIYESSTAVSSDVPMMWLVQRSLPRMEVPEFSCNPMKWVEFAIRFKELVHDKDYLTVNEKFIFLMHHVEDEAKRTIQVFSTNKNGYILTLKRLKYMFG